MNFFRRLFGSGPKQAQDDALHLYVRCQRCGAPVHVRVHPYNDLSVDYDEAGVAGYQLIKEIMDARCFRLMRAELRFDAQRRELSRTISGGDFITREEYEQLTQQNERVGQ